MSQKLPLPDKVADLAGFKDSIGFLNDLFPRVDRSRRRLLVVASAVLLALISLGVIFVVINTRRPHVTYLSQPVIRNDLSLTVSATGPVLANNYNVNFSGSGKIAEIDVSVGQHIQPGQILARQDTALLQDSVDQAQGSLAQARDYGNRDNVSIASAQLKTAQDNLNNATLKAPHAGIVSAINGNVGGLPPSGSAFIQISDLSSLQVQASVNETDIGAVAKGQAVRFTVNAYVNHPFYGKVSAISPVGQTSSSVVTYLVMINVDMDNLGGAFLLSSMTARVTIIIAERSNALMVPASAVNFAQEAVNPGSNADSHSLVDQRKITDALLKAKQMLLYVQKSDTNASKENLTTAFVLERIHNRTVVKPIVVRPIYGAYYEVLAGLSPGDQVLVGVQS